MGAVAETSAPQILLDVGSRANAALAAPVAGQRSARAPR